MALSPLAPPYSDRLYRAAQVLADTEAARITYHPCFAHPGPAAETPGLPPPGPGVNRCLPDRSLHCFIR